MLLSEGLLAFAAIAGRVAALSLIACALPSAFGLNPDRAISQYIRHSWTGDDGLQAVRRLKQTPDGYLWLGTRGGLLRFDGVRFKTYRAGSDGLESSTIQDLVVDGDGSLWVATLGGGVAHLENGHFHSYTSRDGLPSDDIMSLYRAKDGYLWIGTRDGKIAKMGPSGIETIAFDIPPVPVTAFVEMDRSLWFTTYGSGVYRIADGNLINYSPANHGSMARVSGLCFDHEGTLWTTGWDGVARWDGTSFVSDRPISREIPYGIGCVEDRSHNMWITASTGLFRITDGRVGKLDRATGLSADFASDALEDREGNLWVATRGGLDRLRDAPIRTFAEREGAIRNPGPVYWSDDDSIWTASIQGVSRITGGKVSTWPAGVPAGATVLTMLPLQGDAVFLGTDRGGFRWTPSGSRVIPELASLDIHCALRLRSGSILLGTGNQGLVRWDAPRLTKMAPQDNSLVTLAEDSNGVIWAGSNTGGGLYRITGDRIENFSRAEGLRSPNVYVVLIGNDGRLWVGSMGGLSWFHDGKLVTVSSQAGLPSDQVFALTQDQSGRLWMAGYGGIFSLTEKNLDAYASGVQSRLNPTVYGESDGLRFINTVVRAFPAAARASNGHIWFSSAVGLAEVTPPLTGQPRSSAFPVLIEQIRSDGASQPTRGQLRIAPGTRSLEVEYSALTLSTPEAVQFRYKLEPLDSEWIDAGTRRVAYYNNLQPGEYRFRVAATASEGYWHEASILQVQQLPFFYQTWWFVALVAAAGGSLVWAAHRFRVQTALAEMRARSEERIQERVRIAQELHDTVVQAIAGSTMLVENAAEKVPDAMPVLKGTLLRVLDRLDSALSQSRTALAGLRDSVGESNDLPRALEAVKDNFRHSVDFHLEVVGEYDTVHPIVRYEVLRIGSEAISNALQHSDATSVYVELSYLDSLRLIVRDNGRGIERGMLTQGVDGHFGLQGMRERAEQIGSALVVSSRPGHGTEVILTVPAQIAFPGRASAKLRFAWMVWPWKNEKPKSTGDQPRRVSN